MATRLHLPNKIRHRGARSTSCAEFLDRRWLPICGVYSRCAYIAESKGTGTGVLLRKESVLGKLAAMELLDEEALDEAECFFLITAHGWHFNLLQERLPLQHDGNRREVAGFILLVCPKKLKKAGKGNSK